MNQQQLDQVLLAASRTAPAADLLQDPVFAGFASEDEIVAAFAEGRLDPQLSERVRVALAANARLRQQWLACREALAAGQLSVQKADSPVTDRPRWMRRSRYLTGLGMAASLILVLLVTLQLPRQPERSVMDVGHAPLEAMSAPAEKNIQPRLAREYALSMPAKEPGLAPAAQPDPVWGWEMYREVYHGWTYEPDGIYLPFAMLAASLLALEEACQQEDMDNPDWRADSAWPLLRAREALADLRLRYPDELREFVPITKAQWCALGARLDQHAQQSVTDGQRLENNE